ncbi:hypothetical protein QL285_051224 [Trifolium repens]|nr:hypothetical protein QL285_051224 [Trifolium repens]
MTPDAEPKNHREHKLLVPKTRKRTSQNQDNKLAIKTQKQSEADQNRKMNLNLLMKPNKIARRRRHYLMNGNTNTPNSRYRMRKVMCLFEETTPARGEKMMTP